MLEASHGVTCTLLALRLQAAKDEAGSCSASKSKLEGSLKKAAEASSAEGHINFAWLELCCLYLEVCGWLKWSQQQPTWARPSVRRLPLASQGCRPGADRLHACISFASHPALLLPCRMLPPS